MESESVKEQELTKRQKKIVKRKEVFEKMKKDNEINLEGSGPRVGGNIDPPEIKVAGQEWYVFSFVSPIGSSQRAKNIFVKFRGAFATDVEADEHAKKVRVVDPDVDIFIFKAGAWIQVPPPKEHYDAIPMKYMQEKIDKIMDGYYANARKGKIEVEARVKRAKAEADKKNKHYKEKIEVLRKARMENLEKEEGKKEE